MCSNAERAGLCGSPGTATALHRWLTRATPDLHEKIVEIAHVGRRFGCRRVHDLFRPQFSSVNHKRVYRLCRQANLAVRRLKYVKVADDFSHESVNGKIREEHLNGCWFQTLHQARTALAVWRTTTTKAQVALRWVWQKEAGQQRLSGGMVSANDSGD